SLGLAYRNLGDNDRAIEAFMGADDKNYRSAESRYAIAALYAAKKQDDLAIHWLRDAYDAGMTDPARLFGDKNLKKFEGSSTWKETLAASGERMARDASALDFLIGNWSTANSLGGRRTVSYKYEVPDRAISEVWSGSGATDPTGLFVRNSATNKWTYRSVDGLGRLFEGDVEIGQQVTITGTLRYIDGTEYKRRIEFSNTGNVIDYTVTDSRDGGATWDRPTALRLGAFSSGPLPGF
ncbi:MAG TPA: tetratricopeptide repeat protein, partial [Fimbriimonadaceae bacterium]|nr:tetratricopeptide repeat protein [Fimbriimonadaceae bacterium]